MRFSHRLRLLDGWSRAQRSLWLAGLAAALVQLTGHFIPIECLGLWTLAPFPVWLFIVLAASLLQPLPPMRVARRIDTLLGLRERLSTALALQAWQNAFPPALVSAQAQDALAAARSIQPARQLPLPWLKRPLWMAGIAAAALLVLALVPNPMEAVLAQRRAVAQAAKEQAAQVEKLRQVVESAQALTPEERQELLRKLAELAKQLRDNPGNAEQALADLSKAEQALRDKLDPKAAAKAANLESLATQLQTLSGMQKDPSRDQNLAAQEALAKLAEQIKSMDAPSRQPVAAALAQMAAQASQAGDPGLAQALSALAQAAQSGDAQAASQAAQAAQASLQQTQTQLSSQAALQQALSQLQASSQTMSQAAQSGQPVAQSPSASSGQQPGQSPGQNPGQSPGAGQNPGQGQVGSGGGTKANTLPPATRLGKAGRPQGNAPLTQATDLQSQVYAPWQSSPTNGNKLFVPGQDTGQGQTQTNQSQAPQPGTSNPSLVPYSSVYYQYFNAANQAMTQSYIPPSLADYVRQYFSQLEP